MEVADQSAALLKSLSNHAGAIFDKADKLRELFLQIEGLRRQAKLSRENRAISGVIGHLEQKR